MIVTHYLLTRIRERQRPTRYEVNPLETNAQYSRLTGTFTNTSQFHYDKRNQRLQINLLKTKMKLYYM